MKRWAGLIGVGLMFMWGCGLLYFFNIIDRGDAVGRAFGYVGAFAVSASGLSVYLYTNSLEVKIRELEGKLGYSR